MSVKIAVPTGDSRQSVAALLESVGIAAEGYGPGSRVLRSEIREQGLVLRVFRERDIPVQVALGNYDIGICGDVWLAEFEARFPVREVVRLGSLPGPRTQVWLGAAPSSGLEEGSLPPGNGVPGARIVSELPNLADLLALHMRLPGYRLMPVYGAAEAYPPEDAEFALLPAGRAQDVESLGLMPLHRLLDGGLAVVANAAGLGTRQLGAILSRLLPLLTSGRPGLVFPERALEGAMQRESRRCDIARLALPDGHALRHTVESLAAAGIEISDYRGDSGSRRPVSGIAGVEIKVVRPQDMPGLVATGVFDAAVTGFDWLTDHLTRFPGSPVRMAVDLGRSRYKIGPVVEAGFPAERTADALPIWESLGRPVRIASEYPALAEGFARSVQLSRTQIIPISGASEGFVPEDADILIEGSETGTSIRANGLKMLDPFMESTNCLIVREGESVGPKDVVQALVERLESGALAAVG